MVEKEIVKQNSKKKHILPFPAVFIVSKNAFYLTYKREGVMEKTENSAWNILEVNTECNLLHPLSPTRARSGCDIKASRKRVSYQYLSASVPYTPYQSRALHRNGLSIRAVIVLPDNSGTALSERNALKGPSTDKPAPRGTCLNVEL